MSGRSIRGAAGRACVLRGNDIDTDRILPARYMLTLDFEGLGEYALYDDRKQDKNHPLDDPRFEGASILIVDENFGCGSSREHAPQALWRFGFQAFIGLSFSEIFTGNAIAMGLPCVRLAPPDHERLRESVWADPEQEVAIDLEARVVRYRSGELPLLIDPGLRKQLLEGTWDAMQLLLDAGDAIEATARRLPYISGF